MDNMNQGGMPQMDNAPEHKMKQSTFIAIGLVVLAIVAIALVVGFLGNQKTPSEDMEEVRGSLNGTENILSEKDAAQAIDSLGGNGAGNGSNSTISEQERQDALNSLGN